MKLGIEPVVDIVFKYLFANPEHSGIALSLINFVLELSGRPAAASITFANPYSLADFDGAKRTAVDVRAKDENDRDFLVEMQIRTEPSTLERMLDTWARTYIAQIGSGELYEAHHPVISIWILDSRLFPGEHWLHILEVLDRPSGARCLDSFLIVAVELPKRASLPDFDESLILKGGIDEWLYLLARGQDIEPGSPALAGATPEIQEAVEAMAVFTKDEKARYEYEKQVEFVRVQRGLMKHERQLGLEEGVLKGREEANIENARNFKQLGVPVEVIATATGLAKEMIEGL
jgi:predicted transposase/invertase (TIGR01784 family)